MFDSRYHDHRHQSITYIVADARPSSGQVYDYAIITLFRLTLRVYPDVSS